MNENVAHKLISGLPEKTGLVLCESNRRRRPMVDIAVNHCAADVVAPYQYFFNWFYQTTHLADESRL